MKFNPLFAVAAVAALGFTACEKKDAAISDKVDDAKAMVEAKADEAKAGASAKIEAAKDAAKPAEPAK